MIGGLIGLINDARLRKGLPVVGFVNPWLYTLSASGEGAPLVDVTRGRARGCTGINLQTGARISGSIIPWASWNGTAGWDAATGLGMPDLLALVDSALSIVQ